MPAASTTRRNVSSPQRPRAWLDLSTMRNCWVSLARVWLCCASVSSCFLTSPSVADCAVSALLQALLIGLQLLLQRLDQRLDGFLPLGQIALGRLLEFGEVSVGQPQELRRGSA